MDLHFVVIAFIIVLTIVALIFQITVVIDSRAELASLKNFRGSQRKTSELVTELSPGSLSHRCAETFLRLDESRRPLDVETIIEAGEVSEGAKIVHAAPRFLASALLICGLLGTLLLVSATLQGNDLSQLITFLEKEPGEVPDISEPVSNLLKQLGTSFVPSMVGICGTLVIGGIGSILVNPSRSQLLSELSLLAAERFAPQKEDNGSFAKHYISAAETFENIAERLDVHSAALHGVTTNAIGAVEGLNSSLKQLESLKDLVKEIPGQFSTTLETQSDLIRKAGKAVKFMQLSVDGIPERITSSIETRADSIIALLPQISKSVGEELSGGVALARTDLEQIQSSVLVLVEEMQKMTGSSSSQDDGEAIGKIGDHLEAIASATQAFGVGIGNLGGQLGETKQIWEMMPDQIAKALPKSATPLSRPVVVEPAVISQGSVPDLQELRENIVTISSQIFELRQLIESEKSNAQPQAVWRRS